MKRLVFLLAFTCLPIANSKGQAPATPGPAPTASSLGAVTPTAEMWFFEQERHRRNDPREMIREKAEFKARQRQQRIASLKWFGQSNSRPQASPNLFGVTYSPTWVGNSYDPFMWRGSAATTTVIYPEISDR